MLRSPIGARHVTAYPSYIMYRINQKEREGTVYTALKRCGHTA